MTDFVAAPLEIIVRLKKTLVEVSGPALRMVGNPVYLGLLNRRNQEEWG
jgi:hypothetical protein